MKGNKKLLIIAILLLLVVASYSTYAIYKSSASGSASVGTAAWVVNVSSGSQTAANIVSSNTFTLDDITWDTTNRIGQNNKIAPGDRGTVTIKIDADGSEVAVDYAITLDTTAITNSNFSVAAASGSSLTGHINYSATEGEMEATVTLEVVWTGVDSTSANEADIATAAQTLTIPVTVTATQSPNPAA